MKHLMILAMAIASVTTAVLLPSCDSEDSASYEATVAWEIGGLPTCTSSELSEELGGGVLEFDTIQITVWKDKKDIENESKKPVFEGLKTDCSEMEYTIQKLDRGKYYVVVEAIATHQGVTLPYYKGGEEITVPSDETTYVSLRVSTGSVTVGWGFDRGVCGTNHVEEVEVIFKNESGGRDPGSSGKIPCDEEYRFDDLAWGFYSLEVKGYDADGKMTHRGSYVAIMGPDTGEGDAGTDAGAEDANLLEVRPGDDIKSDVAYVVLQKI